MADRRSALLFRWGIRIGLRSAKPGPEHSPSAPKRALSAAIPCGWALKLSAEAGSGSLLHRQGPLAGALFSRKAEDGYLLDKLPEVQGAIGRWTRIRCVAGEHWRFSPFTVTLHPRRRLWRQPGSAFKPFRLRRRPGYRLHAGDAGHGRTLSMPDGAGRLWKQELRRQIRRSFHLCAPLEKTATLMTVRPRPASGHGRRCRIRRAFGLYDKLAPTCGCRSRAAKPR
ncbi:hypothetical protein F2981_32330 (plasmid) [Sinorhizobium meliloti]|nr:hypothetical protein [Sinorhizobium meliloti]